MSSNHIIKSKRGKGGGTYAVRNVFLAYAKYLDAKLHFLVNEAFFNLLYSEIFRILFKSIFQFFSNLQIINTMKKNKIFITDNQRVKKNLLKSVENFIHLFVSVEFNIYICITKSTK